MVYDIDRVDSGLTTEPFAKDSQSRKRKRRMIVRQPMESMLTTGLAGSFENQFITAILDEYFALIPIVSDRDMRHKLVQVIAPASQHLESWDQDRNDWITSKTPFYIQAIIIA